MLYDIDPDDESPEARICRVVNVVESLPPDFAGKPRDEAPLREVLPGGWPTYGDLKALAAKHFKPAQ